MQNSEYTDPRLVAIYDAMNAGVADFLFYESQIAGTPQRIVDIGCGTGSLALRLAAKGHRVTGIDPAPEMLAYARQREGAAAITWQIGDASLLAADAGFDVALMTGHAFQCLLTDQDIQHTLRAIRQSLRPGGQLMFETRNPLITPWQDWTPEASRDVLPLQDGSNLASFTELVDVSDNLVTFRSHYTFEASNEHLVCPNTLRFLTQPELDRHLRQAGFQQIRYFGYWDASPFTANSAELIVIAA
jgi:ubiquinone/menaquinone biosynthesis C-methylase UbiE